MKSILGTAVASVFAKVMMKFNGILDAASSSF